ncbi:hypothetical protein [Actinacidiphila alni]|uniref:hypothetical protein n=1 Tax=Actinacidiphila alni TaxID=380248 RepID=UPI001160B6D4|nr:hypothetical protein [Actinacidiphila alni]
MPKRSHPPSPPRLPSPSARRWRAATAAAALAVLAGGSLAACGSDAKASDAGADAVATTPTTMPAWYAAGGGTHMTTVSRDTTTVDDDASAKDTTSLGTDCVTLLTDVQAAQIFAPAPDADTQQHWSDALDRLAQSAADCRDGVTRSDSALIAKAAKERRAGSTELNQAMKSAAALSG